MEKIAQFRFLSHKFTDTSIKINSDNNLSTEISINIERKIIEIPDTNNMNLLLTTCATDRNKNIEINVTVSAIFEYDPQLAPKEKEQFFKYNAIAIVFPFVRAYINALTALSGIEPIVLPTINFSKAK